MSKKVLAIILLFVLGVAVLAGAYFYMNKKPTVAVKPSEVVVASMMPEASPTLAASPITETTAATSLPVQTTANPIEAIIVTDTGSPTTVTEADSKAIIPLSTDLIKVIVKLSPTSTATSAVLKMTYIADDSALGPVRATVKTVNGQKLAAFGMKKPPAGWPNGPYSLLVSLSTGESKELTFVIQ